MARKPIASPIASPVRPPRAWRQQDQIRPEDPVRQKIYRRAHNTNSEILIPVTEFLWFRIVGYLWLTTNAAASIPELGMTVIEGEQTTAVALNPDWDKIVYFQDFGYPDPSGNGSTNVVSGTAFGPTVQDLLGAFRPYHWLSGSFACIFAPFPPQTFFGDHTVQFGSGIVAWAAGINSSRVKLVVEGVSADQI